MKLCFFLSQKMQGTLTMLLHTCVREHCYLVVMSVFHFLGNWSFYAIFCALVSNKSCSSAWTFAAHDAAAFVKGLDEHGLDEIKLTWTEKSEYTGLWSENLDSPRSYHNCSRPSPFHRIRSHLLFCYKETNFY